MFRDKAFKGLSLELGLVSSNSNISIIEIITWRAQASEI